MDKYRLQEILEKHRDEDFKEAEISPDDFGYKLMCNIYKLGYLRAVQDLSGGKP
jgi:hypothetical protein